MATIGSIRGNAQSVQTQIANLEQDSFSSDPNLNTEVSVLNKINAANVLTLRTFRIPTNSSRHCLEQQTILAKQQRECHHQRHQRRYPAPSESLREHGAGHRHHNRITSKLPHAVGVRKVHPGSKEPTPCSSDFLQFIFQAINNLLTQNLGFFDAMGQNLFRSFATILVVWYGEIRSLLSERQESFHFDNFASLLLTISFGFAMVNYYSEPIPGVGTSFHNLITDESQFLANKINQTELQTVDGAR